MSHCSAWRTSSHAGHSIGPSTLPFARGILRCGKGVVMEEDGNVKPLRKHTMPEYISQQKVLTEVCYTLMTHGISLYLKCI